MQAMPTLVKSLIDTTPGDMRMLLQRFRDHALEERMSPVDTELLMADLGYDSIQAFCADADLPEHVAERWSRFGISFEMRQVLTFMLRQRQRIRKAVTDFESVTHAGLDDFMQEKGVI
ncbi:hypothetical protein [Chelativorans sp. Marseille-P2723]|uniref:hypothetical protein n=1 Tax=Chelativorans sp. Marseille-P2723 TaxID=2709133 RepID=UPI00156EFDAE|nr:hypothetical protein [Chelativorans sp. Marseille-P2723]